MKLEVGKFYRTLSGLKVGPICLYDGGPHYDIDTGGPCGGILWDESGAVVCGTPTEDQHPIVAEWSDEPIFKAGDRVRVATMEWGSGQHGQVGTVEYVDDCPDDDLPVRVVFDPTQPDGGPRYKQSDVYRHANLEAWPPAAAPRELEVGDAVICITDGTADDFGRVGDTGTVFDPPKKNRSGFVMLGVVLARTGARRHVFAERFVLDPQWQAVAPGEASTPSGPPTYEPGDLIRSTSDCCDDIAPGDTFTALLIEGGGEAPWLVTFNHPTSGSRTRFADRYERAEQA